MEHVLMTAESAGWLLYQAMNIGEEMLECGGEVSRVEDSIRRICMAYGAERVDVFTITSSIITTIYSPAFGTVTQTRRVAPLKTDFSRLEELNALSRKICQERPDTSLIAQELKRLQAQPEVSYRVQCAAYMLISSFFSIFFGGSVLDAAVSALIGLILKQLQVFFQKTGLNSFLTVFLCSFLGGLLAKSAVAVGFGNSADFISIGNIMLLIPGLSLTNGIRDLFSGDTLSGSLRFVDAILLSAVIAAGFALAIRV